MRIRTIKPEFWTDKRVASWDLFTRLFYIGLWSAADDHGRGSAEPVRLAAELFPYDLSRDTRETLASISRALARLSGESRVTLYTVGDETFFEISRWNSHQKVDRPGKSRIPTVSEGVLVDSRDSRDTLATLSRLEQGTGNREQGTGEQGAGMQGEVAGGSPTSKAPKLTDDEWLSQLAADPTYAGIDVRREHGKMLRWCEVNGKQPTRRRFLYWLNRAERPMAGRAPNGQHPNDRNLGGGDLWDSTAPGGEDDVPDFTQNSPGLAPG